MAIDQADIVEAQLLKDGRRRHHTLHIFFSAAHKILRLWQCTQCLFTALTQISVKLA